MKTGADLVREAKQRIPEVTVQEVQAMQQKQEPTVLLDVREPNEWNLGHLPQATHIPRGMLEGLVEAQVPRDAKVVIYCASGSRSALAADTLKQMGYGNVSSMAGGFRGWAESGGTVEG